MIAATVCRRTEEGAFLTEEYEGTEAVIPLAEIEARLPLAELYDGAEPA